MKLNGGHIVAKTTNCARGHRWRGEEYEERKGKAGGDMQKESIGSW